MRLSPKKKLKSLLFVSLSGVGAYSLISFYKGEERFYRNFVMPAVHLLDPEDSHRLGIMVSKYRLIPKSTYKDPESLKINLFGKVFPNPIGLAAGFDKNAEAVLGLADLGFGFVEVGSVTPLPQPGNAKPRVFRLEQDLAVINRYGFNNEGHDQILERLMVLKFDASERIVGVNLGKNKASENAIDDYVCGIKKLGPVADYLVINVSSPNTEGLRGLQEKEALRALLTKAVEARDSLPPQTRPPLLVKLAPDLTFEEIKDIVKVIKEADGVIISNTTIQRTSLLKSENRTQAGGLSGLPLRSSSTKMIKEVYELTNGEIPIIGVGGIFSGRDAYDKIKAGASAVQVYTALVYAGPPVVTRIKKELAALLAEDGYKSVSEAVGRSQ